MTNKVKDVNFIVKESDLEWTDESLIPTTPIKGESDEHETLLGDNEIADDETDDMEEYYHD
jgi:hypothetical protein